ncbi:DUF5818 domain-containing protein [Novosphingobium sp. ST904]|uniref:DUF5818 domain-containing protein n=1 Tax=Novosphingobium sp. ST904 TaxID=1684385 RepID=UPI0010532431|nr:DUF5818 domain-containing protein [Novosphingobium sp. ST904]TCM32398.1 hypothetical protein EDF59_12493 [Novosphingobium sp. ST904]
MSETIGVTGTIEASPRGPMLKDTDGMWWRLIGEIDTIATEDDLVRVVGRKRGAAAIEIDYLGPVAS